MSQPSMCPDWLPLRFKVRSETLFAPDCTQPCSATPAADYSAHTDSNETQRPLDLECFFDPPNGLRAALFGPGFLDAGARISFEDPFSAIPQESRSARKQ